ncbi:hypothetical protein AK830_g7173 [Neonectria ditissima]|uniref:RING-type domain-containing protein n=1 Tax=Neonectria ditissima TaxID=78410 RepID=A0A0P7BFP9_9HYPO|nr:hypothetical protein AK830_g7173 [Neonectria ditissima]
MGDRHDHHDPFQLAHPDLVDLLFRQEVFPEGDIDELSENILAEAISLAISLADIDEQIQILSRVMTDQEIAAQGLQHPDVQNMDLRIPLTHNERRIVLRDSPEPDPEEAQAARDRGDCLICGEAAHLAVPCGCPYCLQCLRSAIRAGLRSENDFPPHCCRPFLEDTVRLARRPGLVHLFRMLAAEVAVPPQDRLYCHDGSCATFIPPGSRGVCPGCERRTCEECGRRGHEGLERCGDGAENGNDGEEAEDVWASMDRNRVVNCPGCGRMVSLRDGCNHMSAEFCFICGHRWRTCFCPTWRGYEDMVPVRDRPGLKPERWRRARAGVGAPRLVVPQLRPEPGERPLAWDVPRRRVAVPVRDVPVQPRGRLVRDVERPLERPAEGLFEGPFERPAERPLERLADRPPERPADRPANRPGELPVEEHLQQPRQIELWRPVERLGRWHAQQRRMHQGNHLPPAGEMVNIDEMPVELPEMPRLPQRPIDRGWGELGHAIQEIERDRPRPPPGPQWVRPRRPWNLQEIRQSLLREPEHIREYWTAVLEQEAASLHRLDTPQHPGNNVPYYSLDG